MKFLLSILVLCVSALAILAQTTLSPEDAKRAEIQAVIATLSPGCKSTVSSQTTGNETQKQGCTKLESFKGLLGFVGCTTADYDKLHKAICYLNEVYVG